MGRRSLLVVVCVALGAVPLIAAGPGDAGDPVAAGAPVMDLTLGDEAVAGLPGVLPEGLWVVRVTNTAASDRSLTMARLDGGATRVVARSVGLAPGEQDLVAVRFVPGRWIAAEGGVSRGPAAATLVPAPAPGAPR
jgi:hypothetical protein